MMRVFNIITAYLCLLCQATRYRTLSFFFDLGCFECYYDSEDILDLFSFLYGVIHLMI